MTAAREELSRTADLVGALSLATDAATGFPSETALRTSLLAIRIARASGLGGDSLRDAYYAGALRFLGCTATSHEQARLNDGDDIGFARAFEDVDLGDPVQGIGRALTTLGRGHGPIARVRSLARFLGDPHGAENIARAHCETALRLAERLGMNAGVRQALNQMYERWDGRGAPAHLRGDAISTVARILHVAHVAEVYFRLGGVDAARDEVRRRRAKHFDPAVAATFVSAAPDLLKDLGGSSAWYTFLAEEPPPPAMLRKADLPSVTLAFAHFADLKSPFMLGHSAGVAALARESAALAGLNVSACDLVYTGGLVHDIGRVGVASGIWEKPGPLNVLEWQRVQSHSAETERVLAFSSLLRPIARVAGGAHERLDGSGYHRGLPGSSLEAGERLLAACDVYTAVTEARAHRAARAPGDASRILFEEAKLGRLDRRSVDAVLAAAGHRARKVRGGWPAGLSDREVEVLVLVARGLSNKEIGRALHISARTAQQHIRHLYEKTGVSNRAAAALFAVEHDLTKNAPFGA